MDRQPHIPVETIQAQLKHTNELLASDLPQVAKATLAIMIESLLMDAKMYRGFNHNYWLTGGHEEWLAAGSPEDKSRFVIGPDGHQNKGNDAWVGNNQGEYSRCYFG